MAATRDLAHVRTVLASILPDGDRITAITPLIAGHSNETYVIEGLDAILRLPPAADPLLAGHGIVAQAHIYRALGRQPGAPPVPRIEYLCEDAATLGDPFFVMECVAGQAVPDYSIPVWFTDAPAAKREQVSRQWAEAIGKIATLAPLDVLGRAVTPEDNALEWRTMATDANCPQLVALFDRLLALPAPVSGPPAPVHGDPKIANLMWSDFDLSAVLDWELAYNGEPLSDLGYMIFFFRPEAYSRQPLPSLSGMIGRGEVVAAWERSSGRSAAGWAWYEAAAIGKMAAIIAHGYNLAVAGHSDDARFLRWKERLDANMVVMASIIDDISHRSAH